DCFDGNNQPESFPAQCSRKRLINARSIMGVARLAFLALPLGLDIVRLLVFLIFLVGLIKISWDTLEKIIKMSRVEMLLLLYAFFSKKTFNLCELHFDRELKSCRVMKIKIGTLQTSFL